MFNTWLSRSQSKSLTGKVDNAIALEKRNYLQRNVSQRQNNLVPLFGLGSKDHLDQQTDFLTTKSFPFFNRSFDKKKLKSLFAWYYANRGEALTFSLVEKVQKLGFSYAMRAGISLGVDDLKVPPKKNELLTEAVENLAGTKASVNSGNVTALEEFQQFVDTWHRTSENLKTSVVQNFTLSKGKPKKRSSVALRSEESLVEAKLPTTGEHGPKSIARPMTVEKEKNNFPSKTFDNVIGFKNKNSLLKNLQWSKKETIQKKKTNNLPVVTFTNTKEKISFVGGLNEKKEQSLLLAQNKPQSNNWLLNSNKKHNLSDVNLLQQTMPFELESNFQTPPKNILNPVYMMAFSGARGNLSQVRQLVGMRGLMADPQGQLVEFPIQSNFREGLTVTEYMISCYGARKGIVDTALRTAAAGYLTRRLVDVSHHQIVRFVTCGTKNGILLHAVKKKNQARDWQTLLPSAWKVSPISQKTSDSNKIKAKHLNLTPLPSLKKLNFVVPEPLDRDSSKSWNQSLFQQNFQHLDQSLLKDPNSKPLGQPDKTLLNKKILNSSSRENHINTPDEKKDSLVFCVGRVLAKGIPGFCRNQEIDISLASSPILRQIYETSGIYIRSPLTCAAETGICQLCYGWSVSHNRLVGLGEAVGIIAAQSIGEPGTQLTMRTFHTGGVFSGDIMEECRAKHAGVVYFQTIYLGLLVRTAGGAIAFCLKTPAIFQIKGINQTTTYNVSANTLLFVRQGEKVISESLLAQIPNLPTTEESAGESYKTIVSELAGELRQKNTVNPQLASFRLLAGQQFTQFYFSNSFKPLVLKKNFANDISNSSKNEISIKSYYWKRNKIEHLKTNSKQGSLLLPDINSKSQLRYWPKTSSSLQQLVQKQNQRNQEKVNLIWGSHRLGNNQTFSININGSKSKVVLTVLGTPKQSIPIQQKAHGTSKNSSLHDLNVLPDFYLEANKKLVNTQLFSYLRFFIASKIHQFASSKAFTNNQLALLSLKLNQKEQNTIDHFSSKNYQLIALNSGKANKTYTFPNLKGYCVGEGLSVARGQDAESGKDKSFAFGIKKAIWRNNLNLSLLKNFFAYSTFRSRPFAYELFQWQNNLKYEKNIKSSSYSEKLVSSITHKSTCTLPFSTSYIQFKNKQSNNEIYLNGLSFWPKGYKPNMLNYGYLFWTLKDLVFFQLFNNKPIGHYPQMRILINKKWLGGSYAKGFKKNIDYSLLKTSTLSKKNKGNDFFRDYFSRKNQTSFDAFANSKKMVLEVNQKANKEQLINFLKDWEDIFIKAFPNLILKLFYRNSSWPKTFDEFKTVRDTPKQFDLTSKSQKQELLKPLQRLQDSGEIFPFQGNTNLKDFQKNYRSFKKVTALNSGLLMHYNRVSYKLPLCSTIINSSPISYANKPVILNKERLIFIRSMLALLSIKNKDKNQVDNRYQSFFRTNTLQSVPQIGDFLNTGDEIINECASAHCGQIIEKSPIGLTLRLTQNILYTNFKNRPAKINKNVKNGYWVSKGASLVTLPYISNVTGDIVAGIPKIEQLFEARGETLDETINKIWEAYKNSIVPRSKAVRECFKEIGLFVSFAIQKVYSSQGVHIADKHLEVIIRQMTRRALIVDPGDTEFLPDEFVDLNTIECVNWSTYGDHATYRPRLIGITKASLTSNSFLSSASFQQTARVLERETVLERTDRLLGLKERVMMGALINAGTGELKTTVQLSDLCRAKSLSTKLVKRLSFFSRRKVQETITES